MRDSTNIDTAVVSSSIDADQHNNALWDYDVFPDFYAMRNFSIYTRAKWWMQDWSEAGAESRVFSYS